MFLTSPELYDAIYHFKDYAKEAAALRELIGAATPRSRTLLDVACGTGEHAKFLKDHYAVDGVDLNADYLVAARLKNPAGTYDQADMTDFDLNRTYDVVTCLFSAIGYVRTVERMYRAIACMARHVSAGGVLIVEPWFTPESWTPGTVSINPGDMGSSKVCRMSVSGRKGNLSVLQLNYLHGTADGISYYSEVLELGLFTQTEMTGAFEQAAMAVKYQSPGLMGRGLYVARHR